MIHLTEEAMIHLTEGMILAVRDREPVADEVLAHLDECAVCARALEDARSRAETVEQALSALAEVAGGRGRPDVAAGAGASVVPIARGRRNAVRGTPARGTVSTLRWLGRAAVFVLIGAGALSALPGPFNGWIPRVFTGGPPPAPPSTSAPGLPGQVGGRMEVVSGPVTVRLENVVPGTVIDVRQVAGRAVGVLAATGSEFSYGSGEVRAAVVAGPVTVELPDGVVPATLVVNGATYLVVDAAGMEVAGPATAASGEDLVTFEVPN
jgi:uncharacterized protein YaiE (UPF0345 family)